MTILGHLWIKDETNHLSELLLRTGWLFLSQKWLLTFVFFSRPNSSVGLRGAGPRRVPSSFCTCLKMLRATLSWRYGNTFLVLSLWISRKREVFNFLLLRDIFVPLWFSRVFWTGLFPGPGCGLSGHRTHPGQQGPQDEETHVSRSRPHQPLHELSLPHRDDPDRKGADRPQTRGGDRPEEKGTSAWASRRAASHRCCTDDHLGHLWMNHENKPLNLSSTPALWTGAVSARVATNAAFAPQVSQKKLKKQKLMAREWIWIKVNTC